MARFIWPSFGPQCRTLFGQIVAKLRSNEARQTDLKQITLSHLEAIIQNDQEYLSQQDRIGDATMLDAIQNKCLRTVTGAYKATPKSTPKVEAYVPPINLFLESQLAAFQARLTGSKAEQFIENS